MRLKYHALFSVVPAVMIAYFDLVYGLVFFLVSVLLDIDHIILMIYEKKQLGLRNFYDSLTSWSREKRREEEIYGKLTFCPLHFFEVWVMIALLTRSSTLFLIIAIAGIYHLMFDYIESTIDRKKNKNKRQRRFFIIPYIIHKRGDKNKIQI